MYTPIPPPPFGPPPFGGQPFGPPPFGPPPLGGQPFGQNPASTPPSSGVAPGPVLSVIGAIAVAVSIFMNWGTDTLFDRSRTANEIPLQILWDTTPATFNGFAVRWPLMLGAILMVSGAFKLRAKGAALVGSILALATALLYVNGIRAVHADPLYDIEGSFTDSIGPGPWVCIAGAIIGIFGAIALLRRTSS